MNRATRASDPKYASRLLATLLLLIAGFVFPASFAVAADAPKTPAERLRPAGIDGAVVLGGGGTMPDTVLDRFVKLAGGEKAQLLIIREAVDTEGAREDWMARRPATVKVIDVAKDELETVLKALDGATGVWIGVNSQARLGTLVASGEFGDALGKVLKRGGVVGMEKHPDYASMLISNSTDTKKQKTLGLLPGTIVLPRILDRSQLMLKLLDQGPGLLGFEIDKDTALIVKGRELQVLGASTVTVCLPASELHKERTLELKSGAVHDLTALRRAAIARAEPPFPPKQPATPNVPRGSLVIMGGGGAPPDVIKKFIELAGGPDAPIIVLPQAYGDPIPANVGVAGFERAGAKSVQVLRGREWKEIDDPKNLEMLKKAKAIWFDGGRQWRFVDAFEGTKALELIRAVLNNGGVIGGSSAGASIQAEYMCRGSPLGNLDIMSEGYERGLGFLPGVAVDQHFTQRKRFADMTALMKRYPQLLGIGLDESTAIIVTGSMAEVMGRNKVHFYDRTKPVEEGKPDYEALKAGDRYDLKARKVLANLAAEGK